MIKPSCTREGKKKEKRENVIAFTRSCRFHIKTTCLVIRCSSVLRSNACKFSEEKINQIVVALCSVKVFRDKTVSFCII